MGVISKLTASFEEGCPSVLGPSLPWAHTRGYPPSVHGEIFHLRPPEKVPSSVADENLSGCSMRRLRRRVGESSLAADAVAALNDMSSCGPGEPRVLGASLAQGGLLTGWFLKSESLVRAPRVRPPREP